MVLEVILENFSGFGPVIHTLLVIDGGFVGKLYARTRVIYYNDVTN